jgi:hypothetical protein
MKVKYRGGPYNRKIATMPDGDYILVQSQDTERLFKLATTGKMPDRPILKTGKYSRVISKNKDGSYYFVWMGWDD